ncbi:hypothetical protein GGR54DRAFT_211134 [Hypoxylon sp. NC1633]|nr:hypothetical protein GGR54DRAFT_211134 [Hypoxylon sp. NC1633]
MERVANSFASHRSATIALPPLHSPAFLAPPNYLQFSRVSGSDINPPLPGLNNSAPPVPQEAISLLNSRGSTWPPPGTVSYPQNPMSGEQTGLVQPSYNRSVFPATGHPYPRSSQTPAGANGLESPPYSDSSFSLPMRGVTSDHPPNLVPQSSSHNLQHPMMASHSSGSQPPTPSITAPSENYSRAPTSQGYYSTPTSSTPHQPSYTSFSTLHPSPTPASPVTTGDLRRSMTTFSPHQHHSPMQASPYHNRHYQTYQPLPAMGGAVLSNVNNPGGNPSLVGGIGSMAHGYQHGHMLGPHSMYHHNQQNPHQDRPFKCDVCNQAFNRNHDLKRHKRIHLAIKPFPCTFCEKSFSRKDALKRHRLVKGCGTDDRISQQNGSNNSPRDEIKLDPDDPSSSVDMVKEEPA